MNGLDLILALVLVGGAVFGYRRGGVRQLAGLAAWAAGIAVAFTWSTAAEASLGPKLGTSPAITAAICFVAISLAIACIVKLAGALMHWVIAKLPVLRVANGILGALIGVFETAILLGAILFVLPWIPRTEWTREPLAKSVLAARLSAAAQYPMRIRSGTETD